MKRAVLNKNEPIGKLEIGTVETVYYLPNILSSYIKNYKNVDLSLVTGVTENLEEEVLNHKLDGAFITESNVHPDLESYEVFDEELVLISDTRNLTLEELKNEPFLCFRKGCGYRARLEMWYQDQNIITAKSNGIWNVGNNLTQCFNGTWGIICSKISSCPFRKKWRYPLSSTTK